MSVDEEQSVLLLAVPSAEAAVGEHRLRHDAAAQDGIPGHDAPLPQLRAAEAAVRERLPFTQRIDHAELWAGAAGPWRHCRTYPLGGSR